MNICRSFVLLCLIGVTSCASTTREAEPLKISAVAATKQAPKTHVEPLRIKRGALKQVLSGGPGRFFQHMPVMPYKKAGRFIGFQVMSVFGQSIPHPKGVHVGDIVTSINGKAVTTPDQFIKVWNAMNKAQVLRVELVRNEEALRIEYPIVE